MWTYNGSPIMSGCARIRAREEIGRVAALSTRATSRRSPAATDARSVVVRLTPAGESLRPAFDEISRRFVRFLYAGLSREEAETLERLLGKSLSGTSAQRTSNLERRRSRP